MKEEAYDQERGKFITFEGGEGVGKSTQVEHLSRVLQMMDDCGVCTTREPGGTPQGEELRRRVLAGGLSVEEELACFMEARRIHVAELIKPKLAKGFAVICDRFSLSTIAYQHYGRGLPLELILREDAKARQGLEPDVTFLLDMDLEEAFKRVRRRGGKEGVFENERIEFHQRLRQGYLECAQKDPGRCHVIDASKNELVVSNKIWAIFQNRCL